MWFLPRKLCIFHFEVDDEFSVLRAVPVEFSQAGDETNEMVSCLSRTRN